MTEEETQAMPDTAGRGWSWDFALMLATLVVLAALGVQSLAGTAYSWWAQRTIAGWAETGQGPFITVMNLFAAPLVVTLVALLGLCVPKRMFERRALLVVSALLAAPGVAVATATGSLGRGLGVYLALASLIQLAVVVQTLRGVPSLHYLSESRLTKVGSGLLHMGFLLFALVVAALERSSWMLPVFFVASVLIVGGSAMSFWAPSLAPRNRRRLPATGDTEEAPGPRGGEGPEAP